MSDIQKKFLCPRLIDYLAIVGAPTPRTTASNISSPPVQVNHGNTISFVNTKYTFINQIVSSYVIANNNS